MLECLEARREEEQSAEDYVFPGWDDDTPFGSFPRQWTKLFKDTDLAGITPHVLRHSFASTGNDLGFTEATIAALVGHSRGTVTSRYIHTVDTALIMAADSIAGYIQGLLDGVAFAHTAYALDRASRKAALTPGSSRFSHRREGPLFPFRYSPDELPDLESTIRRQFDDDGGEWISGPANSPTGAMPSKPARC